jgi:hypothetical protein
METYNDRLASAAQQPLGPIPDGQAKKFEAAKDSAFREDLVTNNGGPQYRGGPIPGGAEGGSPKGGANKATGADGGGAFCGGSIDFGPDGRLHVTDFNCGVTGHADWMPGKGVGPGIKDGKPGVAEGNTKDGSSVTTPGDAAKKAGSSSSASGGKSGVPEGLDWFDEKHRIKHDDPAKDLKSDIGPAPPRPDYNDLGPSTNEPEQKAEDAAVARNDDARLGDDLAQRI